MIYTEIFGERRHPLLHIGLITVFNFKVISEVKVEMLLSHWLIGTKMNCELLEKKNPVPALQ